jgi:predicted acetyltransferase
VAGIYHVSAIPEARRRGIGTAMVLETLRAVRAEGYRVGVLTAAAPGASVYRRIGFVDYCLFGVYHWLEGAAPPVEGRSAAGAGGA